MKDGINPTHTHTYTHTKTYLRGRGRDVKRGEKGREWER